MLTYKRLFIVAVVVVVMFCTGCAADSKDTMSTPTPTIAATATPTASPMPTATPLPVRSNDFRFGVWGDSIDVVEEYEKEDGQTPGDKDDKGLYYYDVRLLEHRYTVIYRFSDDRLYKGIYLFEDNVRAYVYPSVYNDLKDTLTGLYSEPTLDKRHELEPNLLRYTDSDAMAIELGYLALETKWQTDSTDIQLAIASTSIGSITLAVNYTSRDIVPAVDTSGL